MANGLVPSRPLRTREMGGAPRKHEASGANARRLRLLCVQVAAYRTGSYAKGVDVSGRQGWLRQAGLAAAPYCVQRSQSGWWVRPWRERRP